MTDSAAPAFHARLKGAFVGIMQWQQLDALWAKVKTGEWYFYQIGETLPLVPLCDDALAQRIDALNELLRREHEYNYCGIVYADDVEDPTLIKIYDPNHMGSSCSSGPPAPPGWILSTAPPYAIALDAPVPNNRRRWWQLFSK